MVYIGGQNSVAADGALVGGEDVAAQTVRALQNAKTALAAGGATIEDVVQWTVLLVDGVDVAEAYMAIAGELAAEEPGLVTAALVAGLAVPGALVEIGAVAAVLR
jgi:enamine deaminase RidA (YjgF/YER057c/UK114 family)